MIVVKTKPIQIEMDQVDPTPAPILDKQVVALADAAAKLVKTGLLFDDLVSVIHRRCPSVSRTDIRRVIDAFEKLGRDYLKK